MAVGIEKFNHCYNSIQSFPTLTAYCMLYIMQVAQVDSPNVSVDGVVFQLIADDLFVLLVKRKGEPFIGYWALPSMPVPAGESTLSVTKRCLEIKAGINRRKLRSVEQLYTFDNLDGDPRGPLLSVTYMGLGRNITPKASQTTEGPLFFAVDELPDDLIPAHHEIINYALGRLRSRLIDTNNVFALLPELFTLSSLQNAYQTILGQTFDKRNFRKKFLGLDLLVATQEYIQEGAHRPAKLYRFKQQKVEDLVRTFV